jgi:predicted transcriptional regulator
MARRSERTTVLTIRVPASLNRRLAKAARARRRTRSAVARDLLETALSGLQIDDPAEEARRQSRLASARAWDGDDLFDFVAGAELGDWR